MEAWSGDMSHEHLTCKWMAPPVRKNKCQLLRGPYHLPYPKTLHGTPTGLPTRPRRGGLGGTCGAADAPRLGSPSAKPRCRKEERVEDMVVVGVLVHKGVKQKQKENTSSGKAEKKGGDEA